VSNRIRRFILFPLVYGLTIWINNPIVKFVTYSNILRKELLKTLSKNTSSSGNINWLNSPKIINPKTNIISYMKCKPNTLKRTLFFEY